MSGSPKDLDLEVLENDDYGGERDDLTRVR